MFNERMTTNEMFEALQALLESGRRDEAGVASDKNHDLIRELQIRQLELEIQNRELRAAQQQLAHSRTRYVDLYDFSPVGYASLDENGSIEEINITGGKLLGDNPHKLLGRLFRDFIAEGDIQKFSDYLKRCRRSRQKRSVEIQLVTRNAACIEVQLFTMATQDVDRHELQFRMAMLNITSRKRAEEALRQSQLELETKIAERTAELKASHKQQEDAQRFLNEAGGVLSVSLDWEITVSSLARAAIPHLADGCIVDVLEDDRSICRVAVAHVQAEKENELWNVEKFPAASTVLETGRALYEPSRMSVPLVVRGQTIGAIGLMLQHEDRRYNLFELALAEDLADRGAIALDNARLYSKEQEANRLKDEFLAVVSHELRTPLLPILGAIYKLRSTRRGDHELETALDMIERNARAQARIVEDLLDISRITTGKLEFHRERTNLLPLVQSAIEVIRPWAQTLGIHLETALEEPKRLVCCDRDRIQQVIWNLLSNAIKFTPQGGSIKVKLESTDNAARIRIADTGIGISAEFLPHVFDRFRQAGNFVTRMQGGLGLGLSVVKYIVEQHGGIVRASSRGEGRGATFVVDLPYC